MSRLDDRWKIDLKKVTFFTFQNCIGLLCDSCGIQVVDWHFKVSHPFFKSSVSTLECWDGISMLYCQGFHLINPCKHLWRKIRAKASDFFFCWAKSVNHFQTNQKYNKSDHHNNHKTQCCLLLQGQWPWNPGFQHQPQGSKSFLPGCHFHPPSQKQNLPDLKRVPQSWHVQLERSCLKIAVTNIVCQQSQNSSLHLWLPAQQCKLFAPEIYQSHPCLQCPPGPKNIIVIILHARNKMSKGRLILLQVPDPFPLQAQRPLFLVHWCCWTWRHTPAVWSSVQHFPPDMKIAMNCAVQQGWCPMSPVTSFPSVDDLNLKHQCSMALKTVHTSQECSPSACSPRPPVA